MTSATFDPRGFDAETEVLEPERVSILAILGLVFGLICFIPFLGLIGVICAIAGLIAINRSRGRLAGTGMAIAGLILGLLFTAIWGAIALGMIGFINMVEKGLVVPLNQAVTAVESENYASARGMLSPASQPLATDESFKLMREGYRGELGAFKSIPTGWELVQAYTGLGPQFQSMQNMQGVRGRNDLIPVPAIFEKGTALLLVSADPPGSNNQKSGQEFKFEFKNITIILPSQKVVNLIDPAAMPPPAVRSITLPPTPPEAPAPEGGAPKDDGPKESSDKDSGGGG